MAEEHKKEGSSGGSGSSAGFLLLFFGGIFVLWFMNQSNQGAGLFGNMGSSTSMASSSISQTESIPEDGSSAETPPASVHSETTPLSPTEVEDELTDAYRQVAEIKKDVEEAKMWGVVSPYKDQISLEKSNARDTDPDSEYLTLSASSNLTASLSISGWRIESYVTGASATIPPAARLPKSGSINTTSAVLLEPGETALIVTGESPLGVSFHENTCTGYLAQNQTFYPTLRRSCPAPLEEMKAYGNIALNDDSCYTFVGQQSSCTRVRTIPSDANLSSACTAFVENDLTYQGCVDNHRYEPHFYNGSWRIYLSRSQELWRLEREVIRLIDAEGRTVSVLEY